MRLNAREDVETKDVWRYGDLIKRTDWIYNNQNHSLQIWKYGDDIIHLRMVDGKTISITEETK